MPDIEVNITTPADTSGAERAEEAVKKLDAAIKKAERKVDKQQFIAEQSGELSELQQLEYELTRVTTGAKMLDAELANIQSGKSDISGNAAYLIEARVRQADTQAEMIQNRMAEIQGFNNLTQAAERAGPAVHTLNGKIDSSNASMGKMGYLSTQAGYQIQDFAVQVGAGTSAATAFAQQAPQLLASMGAAGVLTGGMSLGLSAIAALIPVLVFGLPALSKAFSEVGDSDTRINNVAKVLLELKKSLQAVKTQQEALDSRTLVQTFDEQKKSIEENRIKLDGYVESLKAALVQEAAMAKFRTEDALRTVDKKERAGEYTPAEADKQRAAINLSSVTADLAQKKALDDLELQKISNQKQADEKAMQAAIAGKAVAEAELADREAQIAALKQQMIQRRILDDQLDALQKEQKDAFNNLREKSVGHPSYDEQGNSLSTRDLQAKLDDLTAKIASTITLINQTASRSVKETEVKSTGADGKEQTTKVKAKIETDLDELVKGNEKGVKSLIELGKQVVELDSKAKAAADQVKAANAALEAQTALAKQKDANRAELAQQNNPALAGLEQKAAEATTKLMEEILAKIPAGARTADVTKIVDKLKQINGDGLQKSELDEATQLLMQLQAKMESGSDASRTTYRKIIENQDATNTLLRTAAAVLSGQRTEIDEVHRTIIGIQDQLKNPNP